MMISLEFSLTSLFSFSCFLLYEHGCFLALYDLHFETFASQKASCGDFFAKIVLTLVEIIRNHGLNQSIPNQY